MIRVHRILGLLLACSAVLICGTLHAEGIELGPNDNQTTMITLHGIIDDPDPLGRRYWLMLRDDDLPNRTELNPGGLDELGKNARRRSIRRGAQQAPVTGWIESGPDGYRVVLSRFELGAWRPFLTVTVPSSQLIVAPD